MSTSFQAGQIWRYCTRAGEESSLAYIVQADTLVDDGHTPVFHMYLDGIRIRNPQLAGADGIQTTLPHIPVSLQTLRDSLTELHSSDQPMPDITEGWQQWKEARGGIFTLPLADILDMVEKTIVAHGRPLHQNRAGSAAKASNKQLHKFH